MENLEPYWRVRVTLEHHGKQYTFENDTIGEPGDWYWWEHGNGDCDDNRSLFINEQCDPTFPFMGCGDSIKLVSIEPLFQYTKGPVFLGTGVGWSEPVK